MSGDTFNIDEFAVSMSEHASSEIAEFAKLYFGKEMKELTKAENHEIDCFGIYGVSEWLEEYRSKKETKKLSYNTTHRRR